MKKSNKQKRLPRFKDGNPWAFATDPKNGMTMGQAQGIGNIAAGIGGFTTAVGAKDEEVNGVDYAGNILSNAGSLAASGAALGAGGAIGGAILGAGIGVYQTIEQDKARDRELQQNSINRGLYETSFASDSKRTTDNIRNNYNYRMPGFKNGGIVGNSKPGMTGMMKARMAIANEFGSNSAKRMVSPNPKTGMTPYGVGTHFMSSVDNYAVPLLRDTGKDNLEFFRNPSYDPKEDIRFDREEDARYFAEHYKEIAPMTMNAKFKNGTPSAFSPNAMIANEEGIKDPITGQLSVVPGTYDPSNPDKVMANLTPGTSVYSNSKPVPGGKVLRLNLLLE